MTKWLLTVYIAFVTGALIAAASTPTTASPRRAMPYMDPPWFHAVTNVPANTHRMKVTDHWTKEVDREKLYLVQMALNHDEETRIALGLAMARIAEERGQ